MFRFPSGARLMRFHARHRKTVFAVTAALVAGFCILLGALNVIAPADSGYWLRQLFAARDTGRWWTTSVGIMPRDSGPGVEIVAFDKEFRPGAYSPEALAKEPVLKLMADVRDFRYDRRVHAALLDRLVAAGAKQVVFDFVFEGPGPDPAGDVAFADALKRHRDKAVIGFDYAQAQTVDGTRRARWTTVRDPYELFLADEYPERALGFVNFWPERSNVIARMVGREDKLTLASPGFAAGKTDFEDMSLAARAASRCGASVPFDNVPRLIDFAGPADTIPVTSAHLLVASDGARFAARFKDKVVIVGPYSERHDKLDRHPTPEGFMAGVEIQANALRNWLGGTWLREPFAGNAGAVPVVIVCFFAWLSAVALPRVKGVRRAAMLASVPAGYVVVAFAAFGTAGVFLPVAPVFAALAATLAFGAADFSLAQHERRRIEGLFGSYLSPVVVRRLVASGNEPELGGEQVNLTAFFADVRHFSTFAENLAPTELVALMNAYLGEMTTILGECDGTLDKYVGDGIVAMFGAPAPLTEHARAACECAIRMHRRLAELRDEWAASGGFFAAAGRDMRMRVGLNTGPAIVGNMGSGRRFNYTMMGDAVNLAARCESEAREWGVETVATGDTVAAVRAGLGREILFRKLGDRRVKGRAEIVALYEVVAFADLATPAMRECIRLYEAGLFAEAEKYEPAMPGYAGPDAVNPSRRSAGLRPARSEAE